MAKYRYKPTGQFIDVVRIVSFDGKNPRRFAYCEPDKGIRQPIAMHLLEPAPRENFKVKRTLRCLKGRKQSGLLKMEKRAMVEIDRVNYASDSEWPAEPYSPVKPLRMTAETILQQYQFLFTNGKTVRDMIRFANQQLIDNREKRISLKELGNVIDRTQPIVIG